MTGLSLQPPQPEQPLEPETSAFDVGSSITATESSFSSLDQNLQTISAVERTWRSPGLPDEVRLDLASLPGQTPDDVQSFLRGLDADFQGDDSEFEQEPPPITFDRYDYTFQRSNFDELRVVLADVGGEPVPTAPTEDAVKLFKQRAIERGYLERPQDGVVTEAWTPELNSIRYEMAFDEYNDRKLGNRIGAVPTSDVIDLIGDWTSPGGLLSAATELDLLWDVGAISDEFSSWGDKWRAVGDSSNPLDFAKNLVDAVTGPIDDIAMPIANWALVGTGVGALGMSARLGVLGMKASRGTGALRTLYSAVGRTGARAAAGRTALAQPSLTATRLLRAGEGTARHTVGRGLAAWRAAEPVVRTKQITQFGMRLGAASQAQDLLPGYQGGISAADAIPGVAGAGDFLRSTADNPLFLPAELALAPQNIFNPGTFFGRSAEGAGILNRVGGSFVSALGTAPGRAATGAIIGGATGAAVGEDAGDTLTGALLGGAGAASLPMAGRVLGANRTATRLGLGALAGGGAAVLLDDDATAEDALMGAALGVTAVGANTAWGKYVKKSQNAGKYIGHVSDFLQRTSYQPLADDQRVAKTFDKALRRTLQGDDLTRYTDSFERTGSFKRAYAEFLGVDEESAAASVGYLMTSASIDNTALSYASSSTGVNWSQYHVYRNKMISQLRTFDMEQGLGPLLQDAAYASARRKAGSQQDFVREAERALEDFTADPDRALEFIAGHNRRARELQRQLLSSENIPELATDDFAPFSDVEEVTSLLQPGRQADRLGVIESYLIQETPFQRWQEFTTNTAAVDDMLNRGLFDPAQVKVAKGWDTGRAKRGVEADFEVVPSMPDVDDAITDMAFRSPDVDVETLATSTTLAPLAHTSPHGRMTIAKIDTPTKAELRELADEVKDLVNLSDSLDNMSTAGVTLDRLTVDGVGLEALDRAQVDALIKQAGATGDVASSANKIARAAKRAGMSASELQAHVNRRITELADDAGMWDGLGVSRFARQDDQALTGVDALRTRRKQLNEAQQFTAAEVDMEGLIAHWDEVDPQRASEVRALAEGLERDGYKLVHGVEFMMPHDLVMSPAFRDMTIRNAHASTMGNFFQGRLPSHARAVEERRQALELARELNVGAEDDVVKSALADLHDILRGQKVHAQEMVAGLRDQNFIARKVTAFESSRAPMRLEDLTKHKKLVLNQLAERGWSDDEAAAIWRAVPRFRNTEFQDLGLYAIEANLRSKNQFVGALKFLSGTEYDSLAARTAAGAGLGAAVGAGATALDGDTSVGEALSGAATGAAIGGAGRLLTAPAADRLAPKLAMSQKGYLADSLVRMRDTMRFTLSPFFDISRYTEGLMLAQTAAPTRLDDGTRVVMKLNSSPSGVRSMIRKQLVAEGTSPAEATRLAERKFAEFRGQFHAAAKGDFDPEVLDATGQWFTQVGIMGFNPTDWMAGAFVQLRQQGIDPAKSYEAVRQMYTYGTTGRSAAEMSVNFVFFPFSFQKKALGHIGEFLADDLSRSILLHDMFTTYQILDQNYNLDEMWRDHVPAMKWLNRLNLMAYGVSPGRLGGINRGFVESGLKAHAALFTPAGVKVSNGSDQSELQEVMGSLLPAINDINWMIRDSKDQIYAAAGVTGITSGLTPQAEVRQGYEEWNSYKSDLDDTLRSMGYTFSDMFNKPWLQQFRTEYELQRGQIGLKYPGWTANRTKSAMNRIALEMEKNASLERVLIEGAATANDRHLAEMEQLLEEAKYRLQTRGYEVGGNSGWEDAPPDLFRFMQGEGVRRLREDPGFMSVWKKFYEKEFGLLEAPI